MQCSVIVCDTSRHFTPFVSVWSFCFFQAEDCIRDGHVTGVQTCALPFWAYCFCSSTCQFASPPTGHLSLYTGFRGLVDVARSEERRVGKECRSWRAG